MSSRKEDMLALYEEEGLSMAEIGKEFGISRQRVAQVIGTRGKSAHYGAARQRARKEIYVEAHRRIMGGSNVVAEAERLGINIKSLYGAFSRHKLRLKGDSPTHGTTYRYKRGCRCLECKRAVRDAKRERVERGPPQHGTLSGYQNYNCRCIPCRQAMRENKRTTNQQADRED